MDSVDFGGTQLPECWMKCAVMLNEAEELTSLTLGQIAQRLEATSNEPLPCRLETLSAALKRNRHALKKSATKQPLP
ncbi:hypothetical protein WM25_02170 [Burkholderia ubonensis]|nr:hypothetical protein WM25_02170 [Burkholderia ubonensis]